MQHEMHLHGRKSLKLMRPPPSAFEEICSLGKPRTQYTCFSLTLSHYGYRSHCEIPKHHAHYLSRRQCEVGSCFDHSVPSSARWCHSLHTWATSLSSAAGRHLELCVFHGLSHWPPPRRSTWNSTSCGTFESAHQWTQRCPLRPSVLVEHATFLSPLFRQNGTSGSRIEQMIHTSTL